MCALLRTCTVVGLVRTIRNITSLFCIVTAVCDDDDGGLEWSGRWIVDLVYLSFSVFMYCWVGFVFFEFEDGCIPMHPPSHVCDGYFSRWWRCWSICRFYIVIKRLKFSPCAFVGFPFDLTITIFAIRIHIMLWRLFVYSRIISDIYYCHSNVIRSLFFQSHLLNMFLFVSIAIVFFSRARSICSAPSISRSLPFSKPSFNSFNNIKNNNTMINFSYPYAINTHVRFLSSHVF